MGTVGDNIRKFRTFKGIKQQDLADMLHKSKSVISNWERGENSPDVEICVQICKILDVTPNELFGWEVNRAYEKWLANRARIAQELRIMREQKEALEKRIADYSAQLDSPSAEQETKEIRRSPLPPKPRTNNES